MTLARPSILSMLLWAYWDLHHALRSVRPQALIASAIISTGFAAALIGPVVLTRDPIGQALALLVILTGLCFLLTPFCLAIHRFVLLGELPQRYNFTSQSQSYFGCLALPVLAFSIPSLLQAFTLPVGPVYYSGQLPPGPTGSLAAIALRLAAFAAVPYFFTLLPALSVDAPGANWRNAIIDTNRQIWFALAVTILPFIPLGLLGIATAPLYKMVAGSLTGAIASMLLLGTMLMIALTLGAVVGSRLYQIVGDRLNTPSR